jgi:hypothetical protein
MDAEVTRLTECKNVQTVNVEVSIYVRTGRRQNIDGHAPAR